MTKKQAYKKLCSLVREVDRVIKIKHKLTGALDQFSGGVFEYGHLVNELDELQENLQAEARFYADVYFAQTWHSNGLWTICGRYVKRDPYERGEWVRSACVGLSMLRDREFYPLWRRAEVQFLGSSEIPF